jgi:hypothetical protein
MMAIVPDAARFESIIARMEAAGGLDCSDLRTGDKLTIYVADGQRIDVEVYDPAKGIITVSSQGPWCIWIHITDDWGMALTDTGGARKPHRICAGYRLYLTSWETPAIARIILNGFDLTNPSAKQKN